MKLQTYTISAARRAVKDSNGMALHPIFNAKNIIIGTSRNLAGIRRYVAKSSIPIASIILVEKDNLGGTMKIKFKDGVHFKTDFASFLVLCDWVRRWRAVYGSPLTINGASIVW